LHLADEEYDFGIGVVHELCESGRHRADVLLPSAFGCPLRVAIPRGLGAGCFVHRIRLTVDSVGDRGSLAPQRDVGALVIHDHHGVGGLVDAVLDHGDDVGQRGHPHHGPCRPDQVFVDQDAFGAGDHGSATSADGRVCVDNGMLDAFGQRGVGALLFELLAQRPPLELELGGSVLGVV
jgi:hypothetical protein